MAISPKEQQVQEILDSYGAFLPPAGVRQMAITLCDHTAGWGVGEYHCEECPYVRNEKPRGRRKPRQ